MSEEKRSKSFIPFLRGGSDDTSVVAIVFDSDGNLLVKKAGENFAVPFASDFQSVPPAGERMAIGALDGIVCETWQVEVSGVLCAVNPREALRHLPPEWYVPVSRAAELLCWRRKTRFCGCCGAAAELDGGGEPAVYCPACGSMSYPLLSPAVITAVIRDGKILLGSNRKFRPGLYSIIAGFVEAGESLEDAVVREIYEETGVRVKNVKYFGSQTWPFPHSLMVGFTAEYESGEIVPDGEEIIDAQWFDRDHLPNLPLPPSIAHKIIQAFIDGKIS